MRTNVFKMLAACILLLMSLSVRAQAIEPSETLTEITKSDNCKVYSFTIWRMTLQVTTLRLHTVKAL